MPQPQRVRSDVRLQRASGAEFVLHASGWSKYFRRGEHMKVKYQGETGAILKARFYSADGHEEGVFNGIEWGPAVCLLLFGIGLIFLGLWRYQRDPEGAANTNRPDRHPYGSVDKASLLELSDDQE